MTYRTRYDLIQLHFKSADNFARGVIKEIMYLLLPQFGVGVATLYSTHYTRLGRCAVYFSTLLGNGEVTILLPTKDFLLVGAGVSSASLDCNKGRLSPLVSSDAFSIPPPSEEER